MPKIPNNERKLDQKIAQLEEALTVLRNQKLIQARKRLEAAQQEVANLSGGGSSSTAATRGRPPAAAGKVKGARGGPRGPRLSDEEVVTRLTEVVKAAGAEGISARSAAEKAGVFYLRAGAVMKKLFKVRGTGKWTRFFAK